MPIDLGTIEALYRYPVKSMRGEPLESTTMGWHGFEGDRRFALRRLDAHGGFPWLTASKLPELVLFSPQPRPDASGERLPVLVRTPEGEEMPLHGEALAAEVGRRLGAPVEMMYLNRGIFDDASISVITSTTVHELCRLGGASADVRRFRPNIVVRSTRAVPFEEDEWLGGVLAFGDASDAPSVSVTVRDLRCVIVNVDPDTAALAPEVLKAAARENQSHAGIYATVTRIGTLAVGQRVTLHR